MVLFVSHVCIEIVHQPKPTSLIYKLKLKSSITHIYKPQLSASFHPHENKILQTKMSWKIWYFGQIFWPAFLLKQSFYTVMNRVLIVRHNRYICVQIFSKSGLWLAAPCCMEHRLTSEATRSNQADIIVH